MLPTPFSRNMTNLSGIEPQTFGIAVICIVSHLKVLSQLPLVFCKFGKYVVTSHLSFSVNSQFIKIISSFVLVILCNFYLFV